MSRAAAAARAARRDAAAGAGPGGGAGGGAPGGGLGGAARLALLGDVAAEPLRATGWQVLGRLAATPYDDPRDTPGYLDLDELLADGRVDAVALDGADDRVAGALPLLREAGLLVLLTGPAPRDPDLLRAARAVDGPDALVALQTRWQPWARTAVAALPLAGGPVAQAVVRGWPRGGGPALELVDLLASCCGEVVAVVAAPGPLPAVALPDGTPVAWALLHASGGTSLIAHEGGPPQVRLTTAGARLLAGPDQVRWDGGAALPVAADPSPRWPAGLVQTSLALREVLQTGEPAVGAADLGDLLVAVRVLQALRDAARAETVVPVA